MSRRERAIEAVLKVWPSFEFYSVDRRAVARVVTIVEAELAADLESDETVERALVAYRKVAKDGFDRGMPTLEYQRRAMRAALRSALEG